MRTLTQFAWLFAVTLLTVVILIPAMGFLDRSWATGEPDVTWTNDSKLEAGKITDPAKGVTKGDTTSHPTKEATTTAAVDHYDSQGHHTGHTESKPKLPDKPDPLAPLIQPKRDYWVGTITIQETRDINHDREGKTNIAHALMKGDGYFTQHDEFHLLTTTNITIEPCSDRSQCWSRSSGKVHHTLNSTQTSKDRQPILCRGWPEGKGYGESSLKNEGSKQRVQFADGQVKTSVNVYLQSSDSEWHIQAYVRTEGLECKAVINESSMSDIGCGAKPDPSNPGPQPDSCMFFPHNVDESFSTGNTNITRTACRVRHP